MKKRTLLGLFVGILVTGVAMAGDLVLSAYWQDHMVLQRGKPITVWGRDAAGRTVTVAFAGQTATAVPGADGVWETTFAESFALSAAPQKLTVSDSAGESIELRDVLVGDVFLAAGQSNMDRTLSYKVSFQEPQGVKDFCRDDDGIRFIRIARSAEQSRIGEEQLFDLPSIKTVDDTIKYYGDGHDWAAAKGDDRNSVSSVALNFARYIRDANAAKGQDVPIGIIHASSGGTAIRQWLSADVLKANGYALETSDGWYWNSMMAPILRAKFRAVLWYQGCSDAMMQPDEYKGLMDVLVKDRRDRWGENGDLPFYAVQIGTPGYGPSTGTMNLDQYPAPTENLIGSNYVRVREGQRLWDASETGPHGLVTIVDFVRCMDAGDLHPTDKNFVGRRLSLFARRDIYGETDLQAEGPVFSRAVREADGKVRITFKPGTAKGLTSGRLKMAGELSVSRFVKESGPVKGFALCDAGGNWKDADVTIEGETVVLRAEGVSVPAKFHYGYWCITRTDNTEFGQRLSLYNDDGLPLSPLAPMAVEDANTGAKAADPVFSPAPGFFNPSTNVTISCATTGATIRYTIDGSEPTASSEAYEGPISISATTTVRARAFAAGKEPSGLAVATYVLGTPEAPTADPLWSLGSYDASAWTPLANNILAGKVGTTSGGLAFTSSGYNNNPANLTDGAVPASPDNSKYVGFQKGSSVTWTFDSPQTITEIRCSTQRVPNGDVATALMYAGIHIEDVYVMRSGSADWEALGVPVYQGRAAVEYGTLMAVLADDGIGRLADNVVGLKIAFLKGEVYWSNLAEIEAVGYATADGPVPPLPPDPPDQPEQPDPPGTDDPPDQPPVSKEGLWTTGEYNPATWAPLQGNILAAKTGKTSGTLAWESATKDATVLTDGKVPSAADDGAIVGFCDNAAIEWAFDEAVDLEKVRLTTRWTENEAYALRKHQAGVCVKDVLVRGADETTWTSLNTTLTLKGSGSSAGAMFATLADETSGILAKDATGLKIVFGKGEAVWNCYAEIEAVGKTGGDEQEEPPKAIRLDEPAARPQADYNGSAVSVAFAGEIPEGAAVSAKITVGGVDYFGTVEEDVVTFAVPSDAVTAGNVYDGTITVTVDGTDYTKPVTLEQGTIRIDADATWIAESAETFESTGEWSGEVAEVAGDAIAVSNALFTAAKPSPANAVVTIASTFAFKGTSEEAFNPAAQAGVKVVKVGAALRYVFLTGEGVVTNLEAAADVSAAVCVTVTLDRVAHTVAYAIGDAAFGPFPDAAEKGAVSKVRYAGATEVDVLTGAYRAEWLDANLAQAGGVGYATVAEALEAGASPVRLLWDATWAPSTAGDYTIAKDSFSLVIGGELAYEVKDNGDGTVTVSVAGDDAAEKPAPASITMSGSSIKVGVKDAKANYWYALEKTADLTKEFVVDETTWVKGSEILAGEKELEMALVPEDKSAFYRVVVSTTAPEQKGEE